MEWAPAAHFYVRAHMSVNREQVDQMLERVVELTRISAIWNVLTNEESQAKYVHVIADYEDYFASTSQSLFQSFAVIAYQLLETRKDTVSLSSLLRELKRSRPMEGETVEKQVRLAKSTLGKVFSVRNNIYAHRSKEKPLTDLFSSAGVTPSDVKAVAAVMQSIAIGIASSLIDDDADDLQAEFLLRAQCAAEDTERILQCLEKNVP